MAYNLLNNKKGIIFGALDENSIAWQVALQAHAEGGKFVLTNSPVAVRKGDIYKLAEMCGNAQVIAADVTNLDDLTALFNNSIDILGSKLDFILHSVGMSPNVRKGLDYMELDYDYFMKTLDISAMSLHKVLAIAKKLDALNSFGSVVTLSYIASQRTFASYSDMAQAKAMLESIVRSFGYHYGRYNKVRVNSVSQSPTLTTAGTGVTGFNAFFSYAQCMSPLGNASSKECPEYCITLFSDLTRKVTMQNLFHDGGY
ncbi:MAG: SDR family oxidoreductase, partial [Bacteroidota bacterium]